MSVALDEVHRNVLRRLWPGTRGGRVLVILVVITFFALDVLALAGSDLATDLLIFFGGMAVGAAVAYAMALPLRDRFASSGTWRMAGIALGLASVFAIIVVGTTLAGIPVFPTAAGGNVGNFVYGLAPGFGACFLGVVAPSRRVIGRSVEGRGSPEVRLLLIVGGAVAALFAFTFALYVLFGYVLGPLVRFLAQ